MTPNLFFYQLKNQMCRSYNVITENKKVIGQSHFGSEKKYEV